MSWCSRMCLLRLFVSESVTGFWGVGEGEADEVADDRCQSVTGVGPPRFRVQIVSTKHCNRPKGRNDVRIASLSHRTSGGYKNLPLPRPPPPTTERTDGYIKERVFENFQNFREPRFKMSEPGFWVFSLWVKE